MKRFTRVVLLLLLVELVIAAAFGTRVRRQLERPVTYLGMLDPGCARVGLLG